MDDKPRNFRAFKRALNRKVEREIAKITKLEKIASVLHKRYNESESESESKSENETENIVNTNHDKNNDVTEDNNINVINCNNDEDDHNKSDNFENNELLRHDSSNKMSIENFSENSSVHDTESIHTCTESDAEGIDVQELVSSYETDLEEEQIHCIHINELGQYVAMKIKEWACEEGMLSMRKLQSLLLKLHPVFPNLCLTYKTLLNTVSNIQLIQINDDAPARAKIKCCRDHAGYCACEKCEVIGEYIDNRMTFVELDEPLRTDESYNNQEQPYHHTGHSPLEKIKTGLVSQFRFDAFDFPVVKRFLLTWKMCNEPWKLHRNTIAAISSELILLKPSCPQDFNRPPRSLAEISFYKATEFRRFLLYDGILVLRDYLDENIYKHFLLLHCGIYILSSPVLVKSHYKYAGQLLRTFIKHSVAIYGAKFVVYNVHSMCHLDEECQQHGHLENFSAFVFENKLQCIKRLLHSGYKPLQQATYRDLEKEPQNFIVFKFLTHKGRELTQEDDELYDVVYAEWITDVDENMKAKIKWPSCDAGNFVRKQKSASPDWIEERIIIRRFYEI